MTIRECRNCQYLRGAFGTTLQGNCYRYPPKLVGDVDDNESIRPTVYHSDFCGEFLEKGNCRTCATKNYGGFCTCPSNKKEQPDVLCSHPKTGWTNNDIEVCSICGVAV